MAEPTHDQIAQDYAHALTIIDGLRASNTRLVAALKATCLLLEAVRDSANVERRLRDLVLAEIADAEGRSDV